jgi:plasmid stabilization system protein ParE
MTQRSDYEAIIDDLLREDPDAAVHYHDMVCRKLIFVSVEKGLKTSTSLNA